MDYKSTTEQKPFYESDGIACLHLRRAWW
jgi:hypothetical protein